MTGEPIAIRELEKRFGEVEAVKGVSIDVAAGEFISILGPSGSGKTTLLMMIAGFETPSAGSILIGSRDLTHVPPHKRNLGMVFQKYALFPHMTVAQNIGYPLKMRRLGRSQIEVKVREALDLVQLSNLEARFPHQLSGGQQQRVAVARALVFEPPVLLMDEPLGALDKKLRENMQIEIKSLQQRLGVTVVYVTHDQEEALTMSDRIAVMSDGALMQIGAPDDLYRNPASPFVADFIGKTNFMDVELLNADAQNTTVRVTRNRQITALQNLSGSGRLLRTGASLRLAIRPEALGLAARGGGGDNCIAGEVETAIFSGAFDTFIVRSEGNDAVKLQVQVPSTRDAQKFSAGDKVDVVLDPGAIRLFPSTEAGL